MTPQEVIASAQKQADEIAADLKASGATVSSDKQVIALIAYLQKMGKFEPVKQAHPETGSRLAD